MWNALSEIMSIHTYDALNKFFLDNTRNVDEKAIIIAFEKIGRLWLLAFLLLHQKQQQQMCNFKC